MTNRTRVKPRMRQTAGGILVPDTKLAMPPVPTGQQLIYADPPWDYDDKAASGERGVSFKYPPMKFMELARLNVDRILAEDALCFMWVTCPNLHYSIDVMESWGFEYRTVAFVWVKKNRANMDSDFMGMGNWTRANAELVLLGVKGKPQRISKKVRQIVRWFEDNEPISIDRRILEHSAKPPVFRDRILELVGDIPRTELFARDVSEGWNQYGHGIQGSTFDIKNFLGMRDAEDISKHTHRIVHR